jgi:hypothetical protein
MEASSVGRGQVEGGGEVFLSSVVEQTCNIMYTRMYNFFVLVYMYFVYTFNVMYS